MRSISPRALLWAIVGVQLVAIVSLGTLTVLRFQIWAPIDEHGHFDYVQTIADQHRLPTIDPKLELGVSFGRHTYEAFQPPLYYAAAAPLLKISHAHHTRVTILRAFDLALLLGAVYVLWRLARLAFGTNSLPAFAFGLAFFVLPSVIVRSITVSYEPMAILLVLAFLTLLLKADRTDGREGGRWLLAAAAVLGLALLTTLLVAYVLPLFALVLLRKLWRDRTPASLLRLAACAAVPVLLLSPWLAYNEVHYKALTANGIARDVQQPLINPHNHDYTLAEVPHLTADATRSFLLPDEWGHYYGEVRSLPYVRDVLVVLFLVVPLLLSLLRPRLLVGEPGIFFGLPLALNAVFVEASTVVTNWPLTPGRYIQTSGPAWMLFAYASFGTALRSATALTLLALAGTVGALVLWAEVAPRYF